MKDQDKNPDKPDKKDKKDRDGEKKPDKKLVKAVAKKVRKVLEKELDQAVRQIRKETRQTLETVLAQTLDRLETDMKREIRAALAGGSPERGSGSPERGSGSPERGSGSPERGRADHIRPPDGPDPDDESPYPGEVILDIEPDELHLGDEIPVVEVDGSADGDPSTTRAADDHEKTKRGGKKAKEAPAADPKNTGGHPTPPANPRKRGTAEAEIGSRTGAPASPMAEPDDPDA